MKKIIAGAVLLAAAISPAMADTVVTFAGCSFNYGPYAAYGPSPVGFDQAHCAFASTNVSSVTASNLGNLKIDPSAHGPYNVMLDLHTAAGWVNIFSSANYAVDTLLSSILPATINFGALQADAIALRSAHDEGWSFHGADRAVTFTLGAAGTVPEPMTLGLVSAALAGLAIARRRKQA